MGQRVIVVARDRPVLYTRLVRLFKGQRDILVILDRRQASDRRRGPGSPRSDNRQDRRLRAANEELAARGYIMFTVS